MNNDPSKPPFPEYYDADDEGDKWNLWCKKCDKGWSLKKGNVHPGNLLALLDHARSHRSARKATC